jgi:putative acetyltransferase
MPEDLVVRRAEAEERDALVDIWLRSVRATHAFLSESDIQFYLPLVRGALSAGDLDIWVLASELDQPIGFLGMDRDRIEALFLDPEHRRRGGGRRLVQHARSLSAELRLDVNEQNVDARRFYEACGFIVEGRSEHDGTGRPFPLLHMRAASLEHEP